MIQVILEYSKNLVGIHQLGSIHSSNHTLYFSLVIFRFSYNTSLGKKSSTKRCFALTTASQFSSMVTMCSSLQEVMRHKELTIPKSRMSHSSYIYTILILYKVHRTEVKHPIVITSYPHTSSRITIAIPSSFPLTIQPLSKVTIWVGIRS